MPIRPPTLRLVIPLAAALLLGGCSQLGLNVGGSGSGDGKNSPPPSSFAAFKDMPVPAGATLDLKSTLIMGSGNQWLGRVVLKTGQNMPLIYDFYRQQMPRFGWRSLALMRGLDSFLTFRSGNRIASIALTPATMGGCTADITVSPSPDQEAGTAQAMPSGITDVGSAPANLPVPGTGPVDVQQLPAPPAANSIPATTTTNN